MKTEIYSINYNESFRKININDKEYLVWFNYKSELFEEGKSLLTVEDRDPKNCKSITKIVDIPFNGPRETKERYAFFSRHKKTMENFALWYYNHPSAYEQANFSFKQIL